MKTRAEIVADWLPRHTGLAAERFGRDIVPRNFLGYVESFARRFGVEVVSRRKPMRSSTAEGITILYFGICSAMAATVMDPLSAVEPEAVLSGESAKHLRIETPGPFILSHPLDRGSPHVEDDPSSISKRTRRLRLPAGPRGFERRRHA